MPDRADDSFPLTPALSLRERETLGAAVGPDLCLKAEFRSKRA